MNLLERVHCDLCQPRNFFAPNTFGFSVLGHSIVDSCPLSITGVKLLLIKFFSLRASPRVSSKAFEDTRPTAVNIVKPVWVKAGEKIGNRTPCVYEFTF